MVFFLTRDKKLNCPAKTKLPSISGQIWKISVSWVLGSLLYEKIQILLNPLIFLPIRIIKIFFFVYHFNLKK